MDLVTQHQVHLHKKYDDVPFYWIFATADKIIKDKQSELDALKNR